MTIHPVSKLVGFHQDGAAPILVKTKKTKDRGLSTKKIGTGGPKFAKCEVQGHRVALGDLGFRELRNSGRSRGSREAVT